jgi:hypothetical protein
MDTDCAGCGNGRVEPPETCDPPGACMEQAASCVSDRNLIRTRVGNPLSCNLTCQEIARPCADDGLCPERCDASNDRDCPGCGNEKVEAGESCDPPSVCKVQWANCVSDADAVGTRQGDPETCTFQCLWTRRPCGRMDGWCPGGCAVSDDPDCIGCGNGRREGNETCDPPATCQAASAACTGDAVTVRMRTGDPRACSFKCLESPRPCVSGDRFCGPGCNYESDRECLKPPGGQCTLGTECRTGLCEDARCCRTSCAPCFACTGVGGTCEPVKEGSTDSDCSLTTACNGQGACKLVNGQPCLTAEECLSGLCNSRLTFPRGVCARRRIPPTLPPTMPPVIVAP